MAAVMMTVGRVHDLGRPPIVAVVAKLNGRRPSGVLPCASTVSRQSSVDHGAGMSDMVNNSPQA